MTTDLQNLLSHATSKTFNSNAALLDLVGVLVKKVETLEEQNNLLVTKLEEADARTSVPLTITPANLDEGAITDVVCKYLANMDLAGYIDFDSRETREKLQEAVSNALSDQIEDAVSDAIGNVDLSDAVDQHIRDFDFADAVADTLRYSLDLSEFFPSGNLEEKVETLEKQIKALQSLKEDLKQTFAQTLLRHETEV